MPESCRKSCKNKTKTSANREYAARIQTYKPPILLRTSAARGQWRRRFEFSQSRRLTASSQFLNNRSQRLRAGNSKRFCAHVVGLESVPDLSEPQASVPSGTKSRDQAEPGLSVILISISLPAKQVDALARDWEVEAGKDDLSKLGRAFLNPGAGGRRRQPSAGRPQEDRLGGLRFLYSGFRIPDTEIVTAYTSRSSKACLSCFLPEASN
jgi:hypothetical protein